MLIIAIRRSSNQVVDKIMGESKFKGTPNDPVWAGKWQAKL
jgi:beta-N-acetylhexosaminidase